MKWNVEESNPKTRHHRTLSVDAPDRAAAEALGHFVGLSASDISHAQSRVGARTSPAARAAGASRGRLPIYWIVMLTVVCTLAIVMVAIWMAKPLLAPVASTPASSPNSATETNESDRVASEDPTNSKQAATDDEDMERDTPAPAEGVTEAVDPADRDELDHE